MGMGIGYCKVRKSLAFIFLRDITTSLETQSMVFTVPQEVIFTPLYLSTPAQSSNLACALRKATSKSSDPGGAR
jgi:hypothetical protein